ncbi:methylamine utilization protein MauJ [Tautonia rosea]|uniref:methylamine utilization protein MauJ n=1 Tax=Tautonia rosea TaxID=2728037 RepID=UPI001474D63C|nr:methylamine utilization protein MauJ [Tautonia rosea]
MADSPIWEVVLYVDGPATVHRRVRTTQQKGFRVHDPFYSDIEIMGIPSGLKTTVTARAPDDVVAYKAAVFFFGHMLDALTLAVNHPMYLSLTERERMPAQRHVVRQVIEPEQFESAFSEAHQLARGSPSFLRSLGWYRKGLTTDDPLDRFLAFWNAIEIVASKYYRYVPSIDMERAKKGSKNQVWACFEALWGPCAAWPVIAGRDKWIDESYAVRLDVSHGVAFIDVHKVAEVANRLPAIEEVCYRFLHDWRERFLDIDRRPPTERLPVDEQLLIPE